MFSVILFGWPFTGIRALTAAGGRLSVHAVQAPARSTTSISRSRMLETYAVYGVAGRSVAGHRHPERIFATGHAACRGAGRVRRLACLGSLQHPLSAVLVPATVELLYPEVQASAEDCD